jgi:hypothetical protein
LHLTAIQTTTTLNNFEQLLQNIVVADQSTNLPINTSFIHSSIQSNPIQSIFISTHSFIQPTTQPTTTSFSLSFSPPQLDLILDKLTSIALASSQ